MKPPLKSVAVVTGATSGIGYVFADRLARRGHQLLLVARDAARLDARATDLMRAYGVEARSFAADLSREDDIERLARVLEAGAEIGVLVNNAGFGTKGKIHKTDLEAQMRMLKLHVLAPMRLSRAVLPAMVQRGNGWVINVSSIAGFMYGQGNSNYCATKAYLTRFTQALDTELYKTGVVVQALCPGFTHTEFHDRMKVDKRTINSMLWMSAERVVDESLAAAERGAPVVYIPGKRNRLIVGLVQLLPHSLMRRGKRLGR